MPGSQQTPTQQTLARPAAPSPVPPTPALSDQPPPRAPLALFLRWEWLLVALIIVVVIVNSRLSPFFLRVNNLFRTSSDFMEIGLMMLPMTLVIITANIDLSVASTLGMCASFMGWLFNHGVNIWVAAAAALLLGGLAGLLNGYLVARIRLPALVVTLGTFAFYRGVAYVLLGDEAARGYPPAFTYLGQGRVLNTPAPFSVVLFALLALIFGLLLHRTAFGRALYAIGNNEDAARYSGVPVARAKIIIFVLSGLMAGLAGVIMAARFGSTRPDIGLGLELTVITVAVLGGANIFGGSGTITGGVLALLLIGLLRFGMGLMNIQGQVQSTAVGLLLIGAILVPNLSNRISSRLSTRLSSRRALLDWRTLALALLALAVLLLFGWFFFWSRAPVLAA